MYSLYTPVPALRAPCTRAARDGFFTTSESATPMNYCSHCGARVIEVIPLGDNRLRHVCPACRAVHYQNPKIVTGCIPEWEDRILLCRRAIEPRYGLWTLPAGFMENGETTREGAARESLEEAHARVEVADLFALFDLPGISQVYMIYRGTLLDLEFRAGEESLDVRLFRVAEIPWTELAFPVVEETLRLYAVDLERGDFGLHTGDIRRAPGSPRRYLTTVCS